MTTGVVLSRPEVPIDSPRHVTPSTSNEKPALQLHWKDPGLFSHVCEHPPFSVEHSFTSEATQFRLK